MKTNREVHCPYLRDWVPLGRATKRCPHCGATLESSVHPVRGRATPPRKWARKGRP